MGTALEEDNVPAAVSVDKGEREGSGDSHQLSPHPSKTFLQISLSANIPASNGIEHSFANSHHHAHCFPMHIALVQEQIIIGHALFSAISFTRPSVPLFNGILTLILRMCFGFYGAIDIRTIGEIKFP